METRSWPYFDPDYERNGTRNNPPRVVIDNDAYDDATLVKVDSANRHGILLEVVQALTDLELTITKAYISSDGGWFMDVFHVTGQDGNKIHNKKILDDIKQTLEVKKRREGSFADLKTCPEQSVGAKSVTEHTAIELTGTDRPGLLSEVSAILTTMNCNVNAAEIWTHNMRVACMVYVTDEETKGPIKNAKKLDRIKELLLQVMGGDDDRKGAKTDFPAGVTHTERRLHQLMFADRDYEDCDQMSRNMGGQNRPIITVQNCNERGYSVVTVQCKDRPKLLFDTVCTLTDMQFVVFHASIDSSTTNAVQEYYIRHIDGCTLDERGEQRIKKCLEAAIERRSNEGLRLELCTSDRVGLLSDVTRIFRENGLSVTRADVTTRGDKAVNVFYVTGASGDPVDMKTVEAMRQEMGQVILEVKSPCVPPPPEPEAKKLLTGLLKSSERFFYGLANLGWRSTPIT
ncbi:hypothetical protein CY35_10G049700 [Sphagnum magellanicum]|nr:hypothetical protein CY35_10G049700 [Sphagnum magellanicum]KAH9550002.1 hypothetical protein CY35_10G049700 [Sphagnum magellanicum]